MCIAPTINYYLLQLHYVNAIPQLAEGIMADLWRDFWIHETGTGQQVAHLHDRYMMMITLRFHDNSVFYDISVNLNH